MSDNQDGRRNKRAIAAATACCNEARREGERAATERMEERLLEELRTGVQMGVTSERERIVKFMRRPAVRNEDPSGRLREARFIERGMHNEEADA